LCHAQFPCVLLLEYGFFRKKQILCIPLMFIKVTCAASGLRFDFEIRATDGDVGISSNFLFELINKIK